MEFQEVYSKGEVKGADDILSWLSLCLYINMQSLTLDS